MSEYKEYIVGLKKQENVDNYDLVWSLLEQETQGIKHIPDEALEIKNERNGSHRLCHYMMTEEQAKTLSNHPLVQVVEIPPWHNPNVTIGIRTIQDSNFDKTTSSDGSNVNWGLIRHSLPTNVYGSGLSTSENYEYVLDGTGVDVVIHDTGLQIDHPEFSDADGNSRVQLIDWYREAGVTGTQSSNLYRDTGGHGTHVGGIVAGKTFGWAKNARIYVLPVEGLSPDGIPIDYCFDLVKLWHKNKPLNPVTGVKRPTVVNMSWGFSWTTTYQMAGIYRGQYYAQLGPAQGRTTSMNVRFDSVDIDMEELADAGVIVCVAAGNNTAKIDVEGGLDWDNVMIDGSGAAYYYHRGSSPVGTRSITVGCLDYQLDGNGNERKSYFSAGGPGVETYAAGYYIKSTWSSLAAGGSPYYLNSNYRQHNISGTSMASPQVTGMVALYLQVFPGATPEQVIQWITSDDTAQVDHIYTSGLDNDYTNQYSTFGGTTRIIKSFDVKEALRALPKQIYGNIKLKANYKKTVDVLTLKEAEQYLFLNPGTYKIKVPQGAKKLNALCIGGGGSGATSTLASGGGGGGLRWIHDAAVVPGESLYITVPQGGLTTSNTQLTDGSDGETASVRRLGQNIVYAEGGKKGRSGRPGGKGGQGTPLLVTKVFLGNMGSYTTDYSTGDVSYPSDRQSGVNNTRGDLIGNKIVLPGHQFKSGDVVLYRGRSSASNYVPNSGYDFFRSNDTLGVGLFQNDLYFIHNADSQGFELQHYATNLPGWSSSLYRAILVSNNSHGSGLPFYDSTRQEYADNIDYGSNPATYDPNGSSVDLSVFNQNLYSSTTHNVRYDLFFRVKNVKDYGIKWLQSYAVLGVGYYEVFGPSWSLEFDSVFGGNGGDGGYDSLSYNNLSAGPWVSGGGGGAGGYGLFYTPKPIRSYNNLERYVDRKAIAYNLYNSQSRYVFYVYDSNPNYSEWNGMFNWHQGHYTYHVLKNSDGGSASFTSDPYLYKSKLGRGYGGNAGYNADNAGGGGGTGLETFGNTSIEYGTTTTYPYEIRTANNYNIIYSPWTENYNEQTRVKNNGYNTGGYFANGIGGIHNIGFTAGINTTNNKITIRKTDGVQNVTIISKGTDYFPAPQVSFMPPRMYFVTSSDISYGNIHIPNHGFSGGELVGINNYMEDNTTLIQPVGSNYWGVTGRATAGYLSGLNGSSDIWLSSIAIQTNVTGNRWPIMLNGGYTSYFYVSVSGKDHIRLNQYPDGGGYLSSITGKCKIFNAEYWNWPVFGVASDPDTGEIISANVMYSGTGLFNMDYNTGKLVANTSNTQNNAGLYIKTGQYGSGLNLQLQYNTASTLGQTLTYEFVSTSGHFSPSELELYVTDRNKSFKHIRTKFGGIANTSNGYWTGKNVSEFTTNTTLYTAFGNNFTTPILTTSVVDTRLTLDLQGAANSTMLTQFDWAIKVKESGLKLDTADGTKGKAYYIVTGGNPSYYVINQGGGNGGKYGGGGGGGRYRSINVSNGAQGLVFLSFGEDSVFPSINLMFTTTQKSNIGNIVPHSVTWEPPEITYLDENGLEDNNTEIIFKNLQLMEEYKLKTSSLSDIIDIEPGQIIIPIEEDYIDSANT